MGNVVQKSTHDGILKLGGTELSVSVLEDGTRVITHSAVFKALGREARGNARVINIPAFMDAKNLQPLIDRGLRGVIKKIEYIDKNGNTQSGYNATILPLVADLYLRAREHGVLVSSQIETAKKAEILTRSLAKVAINALIDEATGYQEYRARDALEELLGMYLKEEFATWAKTFPDEFYEQMFKLKGWDYNPNSVKRPGVVGTYTNDLIYDRLAPEILKELEKKNPKTEKGYRKQKHHQWLTEDIGHPKLREHLYGIIGFMRACNKGEWDRFYDMVERAYPKKNGQIKILFEGYKYMPKEKSNSKSSFNKSLKKALDFNPNEEKKPKKQPTPKLF